MPYDGANFFIKVARRALEKYGKLDRETIHKIALEEVATGKLDYTAKDGAIMMSRYRWTEQSTPDPVFGPDDWFLPIVQYEGGQGKIVFPERMKEAEFKAPK
jgi:branched-chain amino acid transport system substrate-binding protein